MLYFLAESRFFLFDMKPINEENQMTQRSTGAIHTYFLMIYIIYLCSAFSLPLTCFAQDLHCTHNLIYYNKSNIAHFGSIHEWGK